MTEPPYQVDTLHCREAVNPPGDPPWFCRYSKWPEALCMSFQSCDHKWTRTCSNSNKARLRTRDDPIWHQTRFRWLSNWAENTMKSCRLAMKWRGNFRTRGLLQLSSDRNIQGLCQISNSLSQSHQLDLAGFRPSQANVKGIGRKVAAQHLSWGLPRTCIRSLNRATSCAWQAIVKDDSGSPNMNSEPTL